MNSQRQAADEEMRLSLVSHWTEEEEHLHRWAEEDPQLRLITTTEM